MKRIKELLTKRSTLVLAISLALVLVLSLGVTFALLKNESNSVTNTFHGVANSVEVDEEFDGTVKKNVTANNTGNVPAYVRIHLVTYRVDEAGQPIGGEAAIPTFTPGEGWISAGEGMYIYSKVVAGGASPEDPLIGEDGITLQEYDDDCGGKQVVEVYAESVVSADAEAVEEAWGVSIESSVITGLAD